MRVWDHYLTDRDRQVYERSGYSTTLPFGQSPVLLIVDVTYAFVGDRPEPILESIEKFHSSCGAEGWDAVKAIAELLYVARKREVPVIYTDVEQPSDLNPSRLLWRNSRGGSVAEVVGDVDGAQIVADIAPAPDDLVISKTGPSAFFGTELISHLESLGADLLLVCGVATSGCVRASVVDAFSYGLNVKVVEECTFDKGQASHAIGLFDMDAKYADVVSLQDAKRYLDSLSQGTPGLDS